MNPFDEIDIEETEEGAAKRPVSTLVFLFAGVLIALAAASLVLVGHVASREADAQAARGELRLFENALKDRLLLLARDQLTVARWDRSVIKIYKTFSKTYLEDEFVDSLWYDFDHDRTYLIAPGGRVMMESAEDDVNFSDRMLKADDGVWIVALRAAELYQTNRIEIDGGYSQKSVPNTRVGDIASFAFATIEGRAALVSAVAVVPDDGTVALPDGPPIVLVSAKFMDPTLVADLNVQLSFDDLKYTAGEAVPEERVHTRIVTASGELLGTFSWKSSTPGTGIWSVVVPNIALLAILLAIAAIGVGRKIGGLTRRLEDSESRNRHMATHDALTGLANRLRFDAALRACGSRLPNRAFAAIACDLDRFKAVNDTHGHAAGDLVIQTVAERMSRIVGDAGMVGRIGGDEFVILMTRYADRPRLRVLSGQIISSVCDPIDIGDGRTTDVGASLGIAIAPDCGDHPTQVMAAADAALYEAKNRGRGCAVFFEELEPETASSDDATDAAATDAA